MAENRTPYKHLTDDERRLKTPARRAARYAKVKGDLAPKPCEVCGTMEDLEMHHDDYRKPLAVRWLCFRHHREFHTVQRKAARALEQQA